MDTWTPKQKTGAELAAEIETIRRYMPKTYESIQKKAAEIGNEAFALVRRALRGEPNCFWCMEAGYVFGTPFNQKGVIDEVARYMVHFGCSAVFMWPAVVKKGVDDGAN